MFEITTRRKGELAVDLPVDTVDKCLFEGCSRAFFVNQGVYFYISLCCKEHAVSRLAVDRCRQEVHVNRQRKRNMCSLEKGISLLFRWLSDKKPQRV